MLRSQSFLPIITLVLTFLFTFLPFPAPVAQKSSPIPLCKTRGRRRSVWSHSTGASGRGCSGTIGDIDVWVSRRLSPCHTCNGPLSADASLPFVYSALRQLSIPSPLPYFHALPSYPLAQPYFPPPSPISRLLLRSLHLWQAPHR